MTGKFFLFVIAFLMCLRFCVATLSICLMSVFLSTYLSISPPVFNLTRDKTGVFLRSLYLEYLDYVCPHLDKHTNTHQGTTNKS